MTRPTFEQRFLDAAGAALLGGIVALLLVAVARSQATQTLTVPTAGAIPLPWDMSARNAATSPDDFPAPSSYSAPHLLVLTRMKARIDSGATVLDAEPWALDPADIAYLEPGVGAYAGTTLVALREPYVAVWHVRGDVREVAALWAWSEKRRAVSVETEER